MFNKNEISELQETICKMLLASDKTAKAILYFGNDMYNRGIKDCFKGAFIGALITGIVIAYIKDKFYKKHEKILQEINDEVDEMMKEEES